MTGLPGVPRRAFIAGAAAAAATACSSRGPQSAPASSITPTTAASAAATTAPAPTFVSFGPRDRPQAALTFHVNGDDSLIAQLLDLLESRHVHVTAFMVGNWVEANPDLVQRFVSDGHELANHTYTHPTFPSLDRASMTTEVTKCRDALSRATGNAGDYFRPSGTVNGIDSPSPQVLEVAHAAGYATVVGFDVDPADYQDPGADFVAQRTLDALQPGSIISLHFGHQGTIEALPAILDGMSTRGVQPVVLRDLLST